MKLGFEILGSPWKPTLFARFGMTCRLRPQLYPKAGKSTKLWKHWLTKKEPAATWSCFKCKQEVISFYWILLAAMLWWIMRPDATWCDLHTGSATSEIRQLWFRPLRKTALKHTETIEAPMTFPGDTLAVSETPFCISTANSPGRKGVGRSSQRASVSVQISIILRSYLDPNFQFHVLLQGVTMDSHLHLVIPDKWYHMGTSIMITLDQLSMFSVHLHHLCRTPFAVQSSRILFKRDCHPDVRLQFSSWPRLI